MITHMKRILILFAFAAAMGSCVPPKATAIADAPVGKKQEKPVEPIVPEPELPPATNEEIRLPPMMNLPKDVEFKATNPDLPKNGSSGVIVRPPTDPPSRVKPPADKPAE